MRVAYLSTEYPPLVYGGLGVYVESMSKALVSLGQEISVFTFGKEGLKRYEELGGVDAFRETPVSMRDGMEVFLSSEALAWGSSLDFLMDLLSYNQLAAADLLREGPFDLCIAHDWLGLPGGMAAKRAGIPLIYHVHGLEIGRSDSPNPQLVALERKGALSANLVLTVSRAMKRQIVGMGVPDGKIRVCYHGIDSVFFDPDRAEPEKLEALRKKYGFRDDDMIVIFMGRLEPVKGLVQLFSAMPAVVSRHPEAKLLVVGKGSLEEWARKEAKRLGFVTLVTDFLDHEEKMRHYALADLCVFPSLYEPFGIVALEAAAMGKPAVVGASGTSGLGEIVENPAQAKPTGVHVDGRSPEDIAWGINLALEKPERLKDWGRNARARAEQEFTLLKAAKRTLQIYEEAAASRS
jgi:glycogen(starch) synthase